MTTIVDLLVTMYKRAALGAIPVYLDTKVSPLDAAPTSAPTNPFRR